jgi:2-polyprenyl-3-methyl-5-hydroxy-6-metoxy-1,4-benzoquinol methylase
VVNLPPNSPYLLESVPCPSCGSDRFEIFFPRAKELYIGLDEWFDVVQCEKCGFFFTNPRPTQDTVGHFYPDCAQYYQPKPHKIKGEGVLKTGIRKRFRQSVMANYFNYDLCRLPRGLDFFPSLMIGRALMSSHVPRFIKDGRLIDIGCAWGGYLWEMNRLGWEVHGIEINATAVAFAREKLGLVNVLGGTLDDLKYPDGFFDVVHMSMVLEHLPDPLQALKKINGILKEGGQLILSVPDFSGVEARLFKEKCYTLQVPQHLSHFTPDTLSRLLKQTGFNVDKIIHQKTKKDFLKSAGYLEKKYVLQILNNPIFKATILAPVMGALAFLGKTSRMSVFASKVGG